MAQQALPVDVERFHYSRRVELDGTFFRFGFHFNDDHRSWYFDLFDDSEVPLVAGLRIKLSSDLLRQYRHLAVPLGRLVCVDVTGEHNEPDEVNFGTSTLLVYEEV